MSTRTSSQYILNYCSKNGCKYNIWKSTSADKKPRRNRENKLMDYTTQFYCCTYLSYPKAKPFFTIFIWIDYVHFEFSRFGWKFGLPKNLLIDNSASKYEYVDNVDLCLFNFVFV